MHGKVSLPHSGRGEREGERGECREGRGRELERGKDKQVGIVKGEKSHF